MEFTKRETTDHILIHCSATPPKLNWTAKDIDVCHRRKGWLAIGYHYVIRRDGVVEPGRPEEAVGAHEPKVNRTSVSVCLVGGVDSANKPSDNFTPEQYAALVALLRRLKDKYPRADITGHYKWANKACPSFDVEAFLIKHHL